MANQQPVSHGRAMTAHPKGSSALPINGAAPPSNDRLNCRASLFKKRIPALVLALILLTLCCTGCLDAVSLERYGYVLAIGFDKGEILPYNVTLLLQKTQTDSESQNSSGFLVVQMECQNLLDGIDTISAGLPLQVDFARTAMMVIQTDLLLDPATSKDIFELPMDQLMIRFNVELFASVGKACDALEGLSNELDANLSRIMQNLSTYSEGTGLIPLTHLSVMLEALHGKAYDVALPLCGITGEEGQTLVKQDSVGQRDYAYVGGSLIIKSEMKTSLAGAALLRDGQMVGYLDGQNVQLLMLTTGAFRKGRRQIAGPNGEPLSIYMIAIQRPQTHFTLAGQTAKATVTIPLLIHVDMPASLSQDMKDSVEQSVAQSLQTETEKLFLCCQRLGCDVMGFGKQAVKHFRTTQAWEAFDWRAVYQRMEVQFVYDVRLRHDVGKSELE